MAVPAGKTARAAGVAQVSIGRHYLSNATCLIRPIGYLSNMANSSKHTSKSRLGRVDREGGGGQPIIIITTIILI